MIPVLLTLLLVATARAQIFTCNDTVTVCLTGVETCCCQEPLTVLCQCCQATEMCYNGTCAVPSVSPTSTPTPSPSRPPGCTPFGGTLSCSGSLDNTVVVVPVNVTTVTGNLLMTNTTTLQLSGAITVNGTVTVNGVIQVDLTEPPTDAFIPLITGKNLTVDPATTVELSGPGAPQPGRNCETLQQTNQVRGGSQFGVLVEADTSACGGSSGQPDGWWAYEILVPVLVLLACCCVCCVGVVVMVFWTRLRICTWSRERDTFNDPIEASR